MAGIIRLFSEVDSSGGWGLSSREVEAGERPLGCRDVLWMWTGGEAFCSRVSHTVGHRACILRKKQEDALIRDFPYVLFQMKKRTKEIVH